MKNILLPTDFSENSKNAIDYALALYKNESCNFYVLNVQKQSDFLLDDLMASTANSTLHNDIIEDNKSELYTFIDRLKMENDSLNFYPLFDFDSLTNAINQTVVANGIDLIVMGTNGATSAKEVIFGSNTLNTIRKVNCPIIIVPEDFKFNGLNSILFSTEDCKSINKEKALPLFKILDLYGAKLSALNIDENHSNTSIDAKLCLEQLFNSYSFNFYNVSLVPSAMAISSCIQLQNHDLHTLFIEPKSIIERLFQGSNTNEITYRTRIPILILRK
ncbi:universal stress protein [Lacinutrix sp. MedPE-SW]|uniref:universal stress protein n=1 Tax=Lacinutrix sp. MedPE-SW TaxID=1860087 RepID=UPI000921BC7F|nr:universal stress protein [Lacinutrix sp. MedPE-SW]OIQ18734.1 MAG: hypothetical protein BM549_11250 [Lacinutrix sp. MedPE-SW]